mmetsp:Transcript_79180/g.226296  ORF Transcript_79180/g.226296 Transcript_79180/m.226296 type:complete len:264 (-) Transcript_79180:30-821(-)
MVKFDVIIILRDLVVLIVVFERRAPVLPLAEASRTLCLFRHVSPVVLRFFARCHTRLFNFGVELRTPARPLHEVNNTLVVLLTLFLPTVLPERLVVGDRKSELARAVIGTHAGEGVVGVGRVIFHFSVIFPPLLECSVWSALGPTMHAIILELTIIFRLGQSKLRLHVFQTHERNTTRHRRRNVVLCSGDAHVHVFVRTRNLTTSVRPRMSPLTTGSNAGWSRTGSVLRVTMVCSWRGWGYSYTTPSRHGQIALRRAGVELRR